MNPEFSLPALQNHLANMSQWASQNLFSWLTITQLIWLLAILLAAHLLARHSDRLTSHMAEWRSYKAALRVYGSGYRIFFLLYVVIGLWLLVLGAHGSGLEFPLLQTLASLGTAWILIRLLSSVIQSSAFFRASSFVIWLIAALFILGWLDPTIALLDRAAIRMGQARFSLLSLVKAALAFTILFWAVRLVSNLTARVLAKSQGLNPSQKVLFNKLSDIVLYGMAILIGLNIAGVDLRALTVFSGALGLGIGFGLQKIFSNLISGIILLLDKSIKPGDTITVGDTYGWVNSLGARHISILTRDGKEHLIPNENLITEEVVNWSHSNPNVRIHIPVGVAYNSDIHKVRELLLEAVTQHPRILKNPAPNCLIMEFGDSAIKHEIRAWISDPAVGVSNVKSDVYYKIWDLFKQHNIKIPFPQRDLHIIAEGEKKGLAEA